MPPESPSDETTMAIRRADRAMVLNHLCASIAHAFGTPLNVIIGRAEMAAAAPDASEKVLRNTRIVAEQARRLADMVQSLSELRNHHPVAGSVHDLGAVADEAVAMLGPLANGCAVRLSRTGDTVHAHIDLHRTLAVLTELIATAIESSEAGGLVSVHVHQQKLDQPADPRQRPGPYASVLVQGGTGPSAQEREQSLRTAYQEPGQQPDLGLCICRRGAEEQGGYLEVHGGGASPVAVTVHLPPG